jgi:hypothetical protein
MPSAKTSSENRRHLTRAMPRQRERRVARAWNRRLLAVHIPGNACPLECTRIAKQNAFRINVLWEGWIVRCANYCARVSPIFHFRAMTAHFGVWCGALVRAELKVRLLTRRRARRTLREKGLVSGLRARLVAKTRGIRVRTFVAARGGRQAGVYATPRCLTVCGGPRAAPPLTAMHLIELAAHTMRQCARGLHEK